MEIKGTVLQVQRFSLDDGPGIRTTVFLKGCPLRCIWCHNPESWKAEPQLRWRKEACVTCGRCVAVCPTGVHEIIDGEHSIHFERCVHCGRCVSACLVNALEIAGRLVTPDEVMKEVLRDCRYYESSGGGMTVSGGEPTMQPEFLKALLSHARRSGIHVCLDTCGQAPWSLYEEILKMVDLFLFDYKVTETGQHFRYTGVSGEQILSNLRRLSHAGANIWLRCPIIPGINDTPEHFAAIRKLRNELPGIEKAQVMPYHNIGKAKWDEIGRWYELKELASVTSEQAALWQSEIDK